LRFVDLLRFMLRQLPGYRWKLSLTIRPITAASATYICEEQTAQPHGIQALDTRVSIF